MSHHLSSGGVCPLCEDKLKAVHNDLADWFRKKVKKTFPDCHISWGYRDQESQNEAVSEGKSRLKFPNSAHNKVPALAIDLFQIDDDGVGAWPPKFFLDIRNIAPPNIVWGGVWKTLGDGDHFELLVNPPDPRYVKDDAS